jgi:hypothetical protein
VHGVKGRRRAVLFHRCYRTSCWTIWIANWNDGVIVPADTLTVATSTSKAIGQDRGQAVHRGVSGAKTKVEGQCGQERSGTTVGGEVPGLQHDVAQETKAQDRIAESPTPGREKAIQPLRTELSLSMTCCMLCPRPRRNATAEPGDGWNRQGSGVEIGHQWAMPVVERRCHAYEPCPPRNGSTAWGWFR